MRPAVLSILAQTYTNWELLIIDDNSTDMSLKSIEDIQDARIKILRDGVNKGLAARLNEAITEARGIYFARMDQDDISYPDRFLKQVELLNREPELDLVAVKSIRISESNEVVDFFPSPSTHAEICARPWNGFYLPHPTWMGRTDWFDKNRYKIPQPYFCEDQELLLRTYDESKFACIPEVLFAYRVRDKVNLKKLLRTRFELLRIKVRFFFGVRRFGFIGLSMLHFLAHIFIDIPNSLIKNYIPFKTWSRRFSLPDEDIAQWKSIRVRFFEE